MTPAIQAKQRLDIFSVHRSVNRKNFASDGRWIGEFPRDQVNHSREFLWHAIAYLAGDDSEVALGNQLILQTPNVNNHFNPIVAAQIALHYGKVLSPAAREAILQILNDAMAEAVDFALATSGVTNFTAMRAFLFLAAGQLLDMYEVPYPHKSIPEVYNQFRLRQFGINVLSLLEKQLADVELAQEFNSPNYSPLTLWAMAEIVNLIKYEPARQAAARIESRLWRELLAFHHPRLSQLAGPYSRAYLNDTVGHTSLWKLLTCFLGLDAAARVQDLIYPPCPGQIVQTGDPSFMQALACWLLRADYHVPTDALRDFQNRRFPYVFQARYAWPGMGFKRPDGTVVVNVEGDCCAPGQGQARCYQEEHFSVGTMSRTYSLQNHPCQVVYHLINDCPPIGSTRSLAVNLSVFHQPEYRINPLGHRVLADLLANHGDFQIEQHKNKVEGRVQPFPWAVHLRDTGWDEISFNLFLSEHLPLNCPVERVSLNGERFLDEPVNRQTTEGRFEIEDGKVKIFCRVRVNRPVDFRIERDGGFVRCAAVRWKKNGEAKPTNLSPIDFDLEVQPRP